jgi:outer membrane murein-binding lipoprotein Lpp
MANGAYGGQRAAAVTKRLHTVEALAATSGGGKRVGCRSGVVSCGNAMGLISYVSANPPGVQLMSSEQGLWKDSSVSSAAETGLEAATAGSTSTADLALVQAECQRLRTRVQQLEQERDAYRRAVYAYELEQITQADLQRYAQPEAGLPLEAFLDELNGIAKGSPS